MSRCLICEAMRNMKCWQCVLAITFVVAAILTIIGISGGSIAGLFGAISAKLIAANVGAILAKIIAGGLVALIAAGGVAVLAYLADLLCCWLGTDDCCNKSQVAFWKRLSELIQEREDSALTEEDATELEELIERLKREGKIDKDEAKKLKEVVKRQRRGVEIEEEEEWEDDD